MKERVTLTLSDQILRRVDGLIDGYQIKNRSHAVELMLLKALGSNVPTKAIILAGGLGTNINKNSEIPKALIPLKGRTVTEFVFDQLKKYGIKEVIMAVGHMKDKIKEYFGDGHQFGMKILYLEEDDNLGTAGPLKLGKHLLDEPFIVTCSDIVFDIDIEEMFRLHKAKNALATVALTTIDDPYNFGVANLSGSNILEFIEKPPKDSSMTKMISAGFYIIEPIVLDLIPKGHTTLEKDIFPKLAADKKLIGYPFSGYWFDTSIPEYYKAAKELLE
ncbi:NTP transferase domain-containing protein [Candidatus Woesearchaeota archaeon]|nr:NTP transferase domain-containing protein [Candidatus Woesearchaeota archaeon]